MQVADRHAEQTGVEDHEQEDEDSTGKIVSSPVEIAAEAADEEVDDGDYEDGISTASEVVEEPVLEEDVVDEEEPDTIIVTQQAGGNDIEGVAVEPVVTVETSNADGNADFIKEEGEATSLVPEDRGTVVERVDEASQTDSGEALVDQGQQGEGSQLSRVAEDGGGVADGVFEEYGNTSQGAQTMERGSDVAQVVQEAVVADVDSPQDNFVRADDDGGGIYIPDYEVASPAPVFVEDEGAVAVVKENIDTRVDSIAVLQEPDPSVLVEVSNGATEGVSEIAVVSDDSDGGLPLRDDIIEAAETVVVEQDLIGSVMTAEVSVGREDREVEVHDGIQLVRQEDTIIVSAENPDTGNDDESLPFAPITTLEGLAKVLVVLEGLPQELSSDAEHEEDGKKEEPQVTIIVSSEVIEQIEALLAQEELDGKFPEISESVLTVDGGGNQHSNITVILEADRIILGGKQENGVDANETVSADSLTPVATAEELAQSFDYILNFGENEETVDLENRDTIDKETRAVKNIEVVMSDEILAYLRTIREEIPPAELDQDAIENSQLIIFTSAGEDGEQVIVTRQEFLAIRQVLTENNIITTSEEENLSIDTSDNHDEPNIVRIGSDEKILSFEANEEPRDCAVVIFEAKKLHTKDKKEEKAKKQFVILKSADKEIKIDTETLQKLIKMQKLKKQENDHFVFVQNQLAEEEVKPSYTSMQHSSNTMPVTLSYQMLVYLLKALNQKMKEHEYAIFYNLLPAA